MGVYKDVRTRKSKKNKDKDVEVITYYYAGKYTDIFTGKVMNYKKRGFNSSSDAKDAEREFLVNVKNKGSVHVLYDELFNEYILATKNLKKEITIERDKQTYRYHLKDTFGNMRADKIKAIHVTKLFHELDDKGYKISYLKKIYAVGCKVFNYAKKTYGYNYNPFEIAGSPKKPGEIRPEMQTWDYNEFKKFISVIDDEMYKVVFTLIYMSGARRGEILALKWKDFYDGKIDIYKTCSKMEGGFVITSPKTKNSVRKVTLDPHTIKLIEDYKISQIVIDGYSEDWYIFGAHRPLSFTTLSHRMERAIIKADVKKIRLHDFRHSHISLLLANGMKLPAVARRAGDTIETVMRTYAHMFDESDMEINIFLKNIHEKYAKSMPNTNEDIKKAL